MNDPAMSPFHHTHNTEGAPGVAGPTGREPAPPRQRGLGLPLIALIGLALLTVPRVILHDLGLVEEGTFVNMVLVFGPAAIWIAVVVARRVPNPFVTLIVVGAISGVMLLIVHQVLWGVAFGGVEPRLGGNLAGLDPLAQSIIMRTFASISSFFTGVVVGAITGLIAWGLSAATGRRAP